ncbi:MAG: hypothetical protein HZC38_02845 [Chloroflexi bacterium]|nr:hypothetical protein [Chloroflexota bacterium]MBI5081580.1 hypothetical protein [Chloroflexota bacterium]MBI5349981.1 hypothetical protein [Chloroflexota bacterium]MBI5712354.1 hypothetical protein [Chloroflexota bacterium]
MTQTTISLTGGGVRDAHTLNIVISIDATINIDSQTARRRVTAWVVSEVGNMLVGGEPTLVIGKQTVWRVPIILTSSKVGEVGSVGVIDVNVEDGEINVSEKLREEILENAKHAVSAA